LNTSNNKTELKLCKKCILPETFPGIKFDDNGVCKYCLKDEKTSAKVPEKKEKYRKKLDQLIEDVRDKAPSYDAIMAYSGGKDSSYTLKILREQYDLRIIALSFDNHFVSPDAWENIKKVTDVLQVDSIIFRPPWETAQKMFCLTAQEDIFSAPTLLRASSICTACIGLVKTIVLKTALEMSIPLVGFGWSPGQAPIQSAIMKTNSALTRQTQMALKKSFPDNMRNKMEHYFLPEAYYEQYEGRFPHNIHPLAFFDYNEDNIKSELNTMGWQGPKDTDTNSSNCLINAFANKHHVDRHGFHPYVWEIANMVRQGIMDRAEGIEKIYTDQNEEMVEFARKRLGL
jgi:hypothetical protein